VIEFLLVLLVLLTCLAMKYFPWLTTGLFLAVGTLPLPALANAANSVDPDRSRSMADVVDSNPTNAASLNRLADQINRRINGSNHRAPQGFEALQLPFLNEFMDNEGNLTLPLGLTVYDTMGTTSIGFGSKF
jgi:hypothetical protein